MVTPAPLRIVNMMQYTLKATGKVVYNLSMPRQEASETNTSPNDTCYLPPLRFVPRPTPLRIMFTATTPSTVEDEDSDDSVFFTPTKSRRSVEDFKASLFDCTFPSPPRAAHAQSARPLGSPSTPAKDEKTKWRGAGRQITMGYLPGMLFSETLNASHDSPTIERLLTVFDTSSLLGEALPTTPPRSAARGHASPSFSPGADVGSFTPTQIPRACSSYAQLLEQSPLHAPVKLASMMELSFSPLCRVPIPKKHLAASSPLAAIIAAPHASPAMKLSLSFSPLKEQRALSPPRTYGQRFMGLLFSPLRATSKAERVIADLEPVPPARGDRPSASSENITPSSNTYLTTIHDTYKRCASLFGELFPGEIDKDGNIPSIPSGSPCRVAQAVSPSPPKLVSSPSRCSLECIPVGASSVPVLVPAPLRESRHILGGHGQAQSAHKRAGCADRGGDSGIFSAASAC
ncbi:hypothetical protein BOTBODRAFT_613291 [Botryobasidium botryosum FD-172 SS1]|uniref:Uncharacterized protein n=1 Tax=Botryobasidium botryosum (strain FD-172 SS1) TaxID=930990 RepID=A0A067LVR1_BOTB1|nr:hypothetical protein BOTBODRAFT_613291 [Botryobasidium botryosum FD-172 SS1]